MSKEKLQRLQQRRQSMRDMHQKKIAALEEEYKQVKEQEVTSRELVDKNKDDITRIDEKVSRMHAHTNSSRDVRMSSSINHTPLYHIDEGYGRRLATKAGNNQCSVFTL